MRPCWQAVNREACLTNFIAGCLAILNQWAKSLRVELLERGYIDTAFMMENAFSAADYVLSN